MKYLFIVVLVLFSGCRVTDDIQTNSDNIFANAKNVSSLSKKVAQLHPEANVNQLQAEAALNQALDDKLREKGLINGDGVVTAVKTAGTMAGSYFGIPAPAIDAGLTLLLSLLGYGGVKKVMSNKKKREALLAETEPAQAKKLL